MAPTVTVAGGGEGIHRGISGKRWVMSVAPISGLHQSRATATSTSHDGPTRPYMVAGRMSISWLHSCIAGSAGPSQ